MNCTGMQKYSSEDSLSERRSLYIGTRARPYANAQFSRAVMGFVCDRDVQMITLFSLFPPKFPSPPFACISCLLRVAPAVIYGSALETRCSNWLSRSARASPVA